MSAIFLFRILQELIFTIFNGVISFKPVILYNRLNINHAMGIISFAMLLVYSIVEMLCSWWGLQIFFSFITHFLFFLGFWFIFSLSILASNGNGLFAFWNWLHIYLMSWLKADDLRAYMCLGFVMCFINKNNTVK